MEFVDTHCHPQFDNFLPEQGRLVDEASDAGVTRLIAVGTTLEDSQKAVKFASGRNSVWASAGVHPHDAPKFLADKGSNEKLTEILGAPKVVAVGEIGLDYYKNYSSKEDQREAFKRQFETGLKSKLPFIFHVREAFADFWQIFDSFNSRPVPIRGVIHSFSASVNDLEEILRRDLYVGLNGIMTFTRDEGQLEAAKKVPKDRLLLETDAPFLAPRPFRGKTCEPRFVVETAKFLAQLRGESLEGLASYTTRNALELFGLTDE